MPGVRAPRPHGRRMAPGSAVDEDKVSPVVTSFVRGVPPGKSMSWTRLPKGPHGRVGPDDAVAAWRRVLGHPRAHQRVIDYEIIDEIHQLRPVAGHYEKAIEAKREAIAVDYRPQLSLIRRPPSPVALWQGAAWKQSNCAPSCAHVTPRTCGSTTRRSSDKSRTCVHPVAVGARPITGGPTRLSRIGCVVHRRARPKTLDIGSRACHARREVVGVGRRRSYPT